MHALPLSDAERAARGIERLPATLDAALKALEGDSVLLAALGDDLARAYLAVKRAESAELSGLALVEEVARLVGAYRQMISPRTRGVAGRRARARDDELERN